eukprot:TRINITY_DN76089_c0_g1_i1.p1 TRINITY_DN76089_c0_g1~~TRINITY_DN76089_c0_g1_i1.p1  ORF type:complete len:343 (+),score=89.57 TRINITY_DN76089_c0_g1_i1:48-1076(+)
MAMKRVASLSAAALAASTVEGTNYSFFCQLKCGDALDNSCNTKGSCDVPANCTQVALTPFTKNDGVCEAFSNSGPVCNSTMGLCFEAVDFQLVWDRHKDFANSYADKDWNGIQMEFLEEAAIFVPGSSSFYFQKDLAQLVAAFHSQQNGSLMAILKQALTSGEGDKRVIHATGGWGLNGTKLEDLPFYARWVENPNGHWVVETLVAAADVQSLKALTTAAPGNDSLFSDIKTRSAEFSKAYNAGDFDKVTSFYADGAVIAPRSDRPFMKTDVKSKKGFLGSKANLDTKIVTKVPGSDAVHEVGFSSSTDAGYLARWTKNSSEWLLETHVFMVFPEAATEILI